MIEARMDLPTPVQEVHLPEFEQRGLRMLIKRDDLIHPHISGNKWRKLKYLVESLRADSSIPVLSFGGAWSNHLRAVATMASMVGMESIGVVRGERVSPLNPTLAYVQQQGMRLHYVDRKTWRRRDEPAFRTELESVLGPFQLIPEGGRCAEGVRGCAEILHEVDEHFDYVACAVGTGTTCAGLIAGLPPSARVIGMPVLKGGEYLRQQIRNLLKISGYPDHGCWSLETGYHFGGFGKRPTTLRNFTDCLTRDTGIAFEPVYTGKLMYGLIDMASRGVFNRGETILVLHTGGVFPAS